MFNSTKNVISNKIRKYILKYKNIKIYISTYVFFKNKVNDNEVTSKFGITSGKALSVDSSTNLNDIYKK